MTGGAVAGAALSGCTALPGSSGGGGSETFTIAGTIPLTGQFSSLGKDMRRGYQLGVERMRQSDEFNQDVELLLKNDESDEQTLRNRLQQMVSNNDVNMLWGSFSSLLVTAGSSFAEQQNLPFIGTAFAYEAPHRRGNGYEWTYAAMPKSRDVARSTLGVLGLIPEGQRPRRVGLWEPDGGWGKEQANYWERKLSNAGYDIVLRRTFSIGTQDFSSLISQSKSAGVEILLSTPTPPGGITAMKQMQSSNFAPKVLQFVRAADPQAWWSALGRTGAYALMCPGWVPGMTGGGNQQLRQLAANQSGGSGNASANGSGGGSANASGNTSASGSGSANGLLPVMVGSSYNVTQVAQQAIAAAESTEPSALQSALRSQKFQTVIGEFGFQDNGLPMQGQLTAPTGQWWQGAQHTVFPDTGGDAAIDLKFPLKPWGQR
jgi:branched-chain amino acid transport system substrate-binding protein